MDVEVVTSTQLKVIYTPFPLFYLVSFMSIKTNNLYISLYTKTIIYLIIKFLTSESGQDTKTIIYEFLRILLSGPYHPSCYVFIHLTTLQVTEKGSQAFEISFNGSGGSGDGTPNKLRTPVGQTTTSSGRKLTKDELDMKMKAAEERRQVRFFVARLRTTLEAASVCY